MQLPSGQWESEANLVGHLNLNRMNFQRNDSIANANVNVKSKDYLQMSLLKSQMQNLD